MPQYTYNRTITQVAIDQAGAGSTDVVAAPGTGLRIFVVGYVVGITANGTIVWNEGTGPTALSGAIPVAANSGLVVGNGAAVILQTNTANSKLTLTSTGGAVDGYLRYFVAPDA